MDILNRIDTSINHLLKIDKLSSVFDHLNYDEWFHDEIEKNHTQSRCVFLRLWESEQHAIVLGRSNSPKVETFEEKSLKDNIPIIKRCSGGGTVLLGPGCLCYTLFIPTHLETCNTIQKTNHYVMNTHKDSLSLCLPNISVQGHTDLCIDNVKFSGNSQRRKKHWILFHGTFLYNYDLSIIDRYLKHPSKEPSYRKARQHLSFLKNCPLPKETLSTSLSSAWNCQSDLEIPLYKSF
ncbi:hypothetical protein DID78_02650 [Candidatus Marinamargulisbacteria bacterium SCGC AG-343-D04]|nr:hypothetical protein DID78_02650 [Candidatus Marinamargulisbacteria bacterium SCGC AG-343-D04]